MLFSSFVLGTDVDLSMQDWDYKQAVERYRANLCLQMLLQLNVYISVGWSLSYLYYLWFSLSVLYNFKGLTMLLAFLVCIHLEILRLYAGYSINLGKGSTCLWLVTTVTPFVLVPMLVYLRLAMPLPILLITILSTTMFVIMALEILVIIGCYVRGSSLALDLQKPAPPTVTTKQFFMPPIPENSAFEI